MYRSLALVALAATLVGPAAVSAAPARGAPTTPGPGRTAPGLDAGALKAEAQARIRANDIPGARELFRRVVEAYPEDLEARLGYARTSAWVQDYPAAESGYREALAQRPGNVEALLGLSDVLAWTGRHGEALDRLSDADAIEPDNPEVWRRRGRFNRWRGDEAASRAAYTRTLALAPGDEEATRALREFAERTTSTLDLAYTREELSSAKAGRFGTDANDLASLQYTYAGFERLTLLGRVNYSNRFGDHEPDADDVQVTGGFAWRFLPRTTLRVEAGFGPDADVLPAVAGEVELLQGLSLGRRGSVVLGAGYRFLDFNRNVRQIAPQPAPRFEIDPATQVHILTPSLEWYTPWPLVLLARYYLSISDFESITAPPGAGFASSAGGTDTTSSILLRATIAPDARFSPFVAYARGVESFATAAQLRGLTTDTYAAGATIRLTRRVGLRAAYEYQDSGRDTQGGTITQQNFTVGTFVSW
jgi:tetratricopeptide (TPR) repeat protein